MAIEPDIIKNHDDEDWQFLRSIEVILKRNSLLDRYLQDKLTTSVSRKILEIRIWPD